MNSDYQTILTKYRTYLHKVILMFENGLNIINDIPLVQPGMVAELNKARLIEIMSGKNINTNVPEDIKAMEQRIVGYKLRFNVPTSIHEGFHSLEYDIDDLMKRKQTPGLRFPKDEYDKLLLTYLTSIGQQGGRYRRKSRRKSRHRKSRKYHRRH